MTLPNAIVEFFKWAVNRFKLEQAFNHLKIQGLDTSEESVRAEYVRRAGLVLDESVPEEAPSDEEEAEKPKRKSKKA